MWKIICHTEGHVNAFELWTVRTDCTSSDMAVVLLSNLALVKIRHDSRIYVFSGEIQGIDPFPNIFSDDTNIRVPFEVRSEL